MQAGSWSLFDAIIACSPTQERRHMIELHTARDAQKCHEIPSVGFICGLNNTRGRHTKLSKCLPLYHLLQLGNANFIVDQ